MKERTNKKTTSFDYYQSINKIISYEALKWERNFTFVIYFKIKLFQVFAQVF